MIYNFVGRNIVILNFNDLEDLNGHIIPTEAYCKLVNPIPILYSGDHKKVLGNCYIFRVENQLWCDMYLTSKYADDKALYRYSKLTPSLSFIPLEMHKNFILMFQPCYLSLSLNPNADRTIGPLLDKIRFIDSGEYVN